MPVNIKIDRSDVISIMAMLLSLGAIFVSIKQTDILKEQQKIMASQQEGSVWPHLEIGPEINSDDVSASFLLQLKNNGVGPAIVTDFKFNKESQTKLDETELLKLVEKLDLAPILGYKFIHPNGRTIPADTKVDLVYLKVADPNKNFEKLYELMDELINNHFCYESLYKTKYGENCN